MMLLPAVIYPGGTRVLAWRLEEEVPALVALCREAGIPVDDLLDLPPKRQREKAVELLLLCRALGQPVALRHDVQGAPVVEGHEEVNISVTHTPRLVALAVNEQVVIGLDAEQCDRRQVIRVRDKFLNASEQQFIAPDDLAAHVTAWTAKEAIIKAERNSALDWTEGIRLEPFAVNPGQTLFGARCENRVYRLSTRPIDGHYVTVATPVTD